MTPISKIPRYNCELFCCTFSLTLAISRSRVICGRLQNFLREMFTMYKLEKVRDLFFERRLSAASDDGNECNFMDKFNAFISSVNEKFPASEKNVHFWASEKFQVGSCMLRKVLLSVEVEGFLLIVVSILWDFIET